MAMDTWDSILEELNCIALKRGNMIEFVNVWPGSSLAVSFRVLVKHAYWKQKPMFK